MPEQDVTQEQGATQEQRSPRQEYCLAMLRWGIQALRTVKCESMEEYQYRINVLGYLGDCYIKEGGAMEELQSMDTDEWFFVEPGTMPFDPEGRTQGRT